MTKSKTLNAVFAIQFSTRIVQESFTTSSHFYNGLLSFLKLMNFTSSWIVKKSPHKVLSTKKVFQIEIYTRMIDAKDNIVEDLPIYGHQFGRQDQDDTSALPYFIT